MHIIQPSLIWVTCPFTPKTNPICSDDATMKAVMQCQRNCSDGCFFYKKKRRKKKSQTVMLIFTDRERQSKLTKVGGKAITHTPVLFYYSFYSSCTHVVSERLIRQTQRQVIHLNKWWRMRRIKDSHIPHVTSLIILFYPALSLFVYFHFFHSFIRLPLCPLQMWANIDTCSVFLSESTS